MNNPMYIAVHTVCLADGKGTGGYQVYELAALGAPVYVCHNRVKNDPVPLEACLERVDALNKETRNAAPMPG